MSLLDRINQIVETPFASLEDCLAFYRKELPTRVGNYHQEEVGPIYHKDAPGEADKFVRKQFALGEDTVDMSAGLNWYATAKGDLEWNGGLVRQGYFMLLAKEYVATGKEIYAETILEHMLHYIENVPPFEPAGKPYLQYKKSTWRPFEAAGRAAETWPEALAKIINSPAMTAEAWGKILYSVYQHAVFLRKEHWKTGNHATLEVAAVGIISIFYKEFKESNAWREYAVKFLNGMWDELFNADGYSKEMSGSYHWVAVRSFFSFYEVAVNNGFGDIFDEQYKQRLILNGMAEFWQDKPNYSTPITNDSNTKINRREQLERIAKIFDVPAISYRLSDGKEGTPAAQNSYFYPVSHVGIMRSDWSSQANYLFFDMGGWGDNHMNQDQLNIEIYAKGRHFLVNGGKWRYTTSDPDADWMPMAKYFKATSSYNCVLVNGYEQIFGDTSDAQMTIADGYDYAEGTFACGFGEEVPGRDEVLFSTRGISTLMEKRLPDAKHTRKVFFVKPDFWIVRDEISGVGVNDAQQLWHFYDGELKQSAKDASLWHTQFDDANLIIQSLGDGKMSTQTYLGSKNPIAGWHCPYYDIERPAPELRFKQEADGSIVFNTLLFPVSGPVVELPKFEVTASGYTISYAGKSWTITAPAKGKWTLA
jgi:hypothetical protein